MPFSFQKLWRSRVFRVTVALFAIGNAYSGLSQRFNSSSSAQEITVGFPVPFHISSAITDAENFYFLGLLLDIAIAFTVAVVLTWIRELLRSDG